MTTSCLVTENREVIFGGGDLYRYRTDVFFVVFFFALTKFSVLSCIMSTSDGWSDDDALLQSLFLSTSQTFLSLRLGFLDLNSTFFFVEIVLSRSYQFILNVCLHERHQQYDNTILKYNESSIQKYINTLIEINNNNTEIQYYDKTVIRWYNKIAIHQYCNAIDQKMYQYSESVMK